MRAVLISLFIFVFSGLAMACGCGHGSGCGSCGTSPCAYDNPDWGYSYQNPHYLPDGASRALRCFHNAFIPMYEARHSRESAYLRENANELYCAAKRITDGKYEDCSMRCCSDPAQKKHYKRAVKDLVKSCARLKEVAWGGANAEVYDQMRQIENDYIRVANLSE